VAGVNKVLKPNEVLFNIGDPADAMYIVRKGSLKVYFPKGSEEVTVASLKDGAIVGEMAFFDDKPRSASVKAVDNTEVTVISKADFEKLLTQVPKWMVSMMQSLVARLRQTNERLQAMEAGAAGVAKDGGAPAKSLILPGQKFPFQHSLRAIQVLLLAHAKDGEKEGREVLVQKEFPLRLWNELVGEEQVYFDKTMASLEKAKFISSKVDSRKIPIFVFVNRGTLANFVEFFAKVAKGLKPLQPFFSPDAMELFASLVDVVGESGYDSINIGLKTHCATCAAKGKNTAGWGKALVELAALPDMKIAKAGDDVTVKILAKEHKLMLTYLKTMESLKEAGLV
jgi:CRP-like cAMP-binding protein